MMGDRGLSEKSGLKLNLESGCSDVLRNEEKPDYWKKPLTRRCWEGGQPRGQIGLREKHQEDGVA